MSASNGNAAMPNGAPTEAVLNGHPPTSAEPSQTTPTREQIRGLNLHQRIAEIRKRCTSLPRKQHNEEGWDFASHDQVVDLLRGLMAEFGVNIYQEPLEFSTEATLGDLILNKVKFQYEVVNADNPEDRLTKHNFGLCYGLNDKAYNWCSTISEKYFLLRLFNIATYDDPDANAPAAGRDSRTAKRDSQGRSPAAGRSRPANECEQCGFLITFMRKDDETWSKEEIIKASLKKHNKRLCGRCFFEQESRDSKTTAASGGTDPKDQPEPAGASEPSPTGSGD